MLAPGKPPKPPKIGTTLIDSWKGGYVSALDDGRTPADGLRDASNLILTQDGTVRPRPSLQKYGPQPTGTVLGRTYEFRQLVEGVSTNWLINLQNVSGTVNAYVAKPEDTTWTKCNGGDDVTFSTSASGRYFQIADKVIIMTGTDTLCYFDITTVDDASPTVVTFTAIADATAPTIANNGSTSVIDASTNPYTIYYAVTANSTIGQTTGVAKSQAIDLQRSQWDKTKNSLKITWTAVTAAESYNIYCAVTADGDANPQLFLLANNISADTTTYVDDGSVPLGIVEMPTTNSTAGPKARYGTAINGRLWLWGDPDEPDKIRYGGNYLHELDFSGANGSGFLAIGNGTTEVPAVLWNFRSGQGDPQIKVLTKGLSGNGKRYTISQITVSLGDQSTTAWVSQEDYGFTGTNSPDALIVYGNSSYYPSRDGFKTTGTKPQLQNLLSTDGVSDTILDTLGQINWNAMDGCIGLGFEERLYWCLPVGSDSNTQIWVLDLQRGGAWMLPWTVAADDMLLIEDNDGATHHVVLSNNTFYEFSYATKTNDDGEAFTTSGSTGLNYFSKDGRDWARVIRLVSEILRLQGTINFTVYGYTNKKVQEPIASGSMTVETDVSGYGWSEAGWSSYGWSALPNVPDITAKPSVDVPIKINKDLRYWSLSWHTTSKNTDYALSKIVTEQVSIGVRNLS